jgi:hypothetical protein
MLSLAWMFFRGIRIFFLGYIFVGLDVVSRDLGLVSGVFILQWEYFCGVSGYWGIFVTWGILLLGMGCFFKLRRLPGSSSSHSLKIFYNAFAVTICCGVPLNRFNR